MNLRSFLVIGGFLIVCGLVIRVHRLLNILIVLESLNVLLLTCCLLCQAEETRMLFISLMVIFTTEVTLGLVVITRL